MPSEAEVYTQHAHQYERLVRCEDYAGEYPSTLKRLAPLEGLEVIELGAGTARLTRLLAPQVKPHPGVGQLIAHVVGRGSVPQ